jgi:hypothetical protein
VEPFESMQKEQDLFLDQLVIVNMRQLDQNMVFI